MKKLVILLVFAVFCSGATKQIKNSYNAGELSAYMDGRTDISKYHNGCSVLINATVLPHGGVVKRSGTEYIATASGPGNLKAFEFSVDDVQVLGFSDLYLRFFKNGAPVFAPLGTEDLSSLSANLTAHWKLNDNLSTASTISSAPIGFLTVQTASGVGLLYDGDLSLSATSTATTTDSADQTNRAFDMNILSSHKGMVEVPDSASFSFDSSADAFSIQAWVKYTASSIKQDIISKWNNNNQEWSLFVNSNDKVVFRVYDDNTGFFSDVTSDDLLGPDWTIINTTYDGIGGDTAANGMELYINWSLVNGSKTNSASFTTMLDTTASLSIGGINGRAQSQITASPPNPTTNIGGMTFKDGLSAVFDGVIDQATDRCAASSPASRITKVGKDWGDGNDKFVTGFKIFGSTDEGYVNAENNTIIVTLQGSANNSTWVNITASTATDLSAQSPGLKLENMLVTASTAYRYHRVAIRHNGTSGAQMYCAETQFYDTGGATWIGKLDNIALFDKELTASEVSTLQADNSTIPYAIITPYTASQTLQIHTTQSADVMYIAHTSHHPRKLSRLSDTSWTITDVPFTGGPFLEENTEEAKLLGFARTGGAVRDGYYFPAGATGTLTATAHSPFNANMVNGLWLITHTRPDNVASAPDNVIGAAPTSTASAIRTKGDFVFETEGYGADDRTTLWRKEGAGDWQSFRSFTAAAAFSGTEDENDTYYAYNDNAAGDTQTSTFTAKNQLNRGIVKVISFLSSTVVNVEVVDKVLSDNATNNANTTSMWAEGAWSDFRGFPRTVTFYEDRLWWASTTNNPDTLWASKNRFYENHEFTDLGVDDDALIFPLNDNEVSQIQWMNARQVMAIGAANKEYRLSANNIDDAITPTDRKATPQTSFGSDDIQPVILNNAVFFFQRQGRKLRAMKFDAITENFDAEDATLLAYTIFESPPVGMAVQRVPDAIIWSVREDGVMPTFTYEPDEEVAGWARQIFGNFANVETPTGFAESVAVIHGSAEDEVWVSVRRTIDGDIVYYIERFKPRNWGDDIEDAFFVDAGLTYDSIATASMTGLDHLEGETVAVFADGVVLDDEVVQQGGIILSLDGVGTIASTVQMGLPYTMKARTMRLSVPQEGNTLQTRIKNIHFTVVRFIRSLLGSAGQEYDGVEYLQDLGAEFSNESEDTDENRRSTLGGFSEDAYTTIVSDDPVPFTILSTTITFEVAELR